ncbi:NAD(P)/FAD-dependent oxidoreductase [Marispirochaeta sp.]|uniref:NAD(P)/FAD-dependent oxidoreductase n=1 Tax=Marispirochaeta sp. TaxID=2038653 RepID=UPI0029C864FF|nr:NAD(P)/FAD-dependent oxidoreductase [Marispirochaeta sp.]
MAGTFFDYVIVGASRAGVSCAEGIRSVDSAGSILLVSREDVLPYKRTKLSKELHKNYGDQDFLLHPLQWYEDQKITVYLGAEAVDLAPKIYTLFLADGRKIAYGRLCIASGASPLEIQDHPFLFRYLREKSDGQNIFHKAQEWKHICVAGNGIQGVELAEQFSLMGKQVDLLGPESRPMANRLDPGMSRLVEKTLISHGIKVYNQKGSSAGTDAGDWDGTVASIGVRPAAVWLRDSGINTLSGVIIDTRCRTSEAEIFAAGDVAEPVFPFTSGLWHSAEYQGFTAGVNMAGRDVELEQQPFRLKLDLFDKHFYALWYTPGLEADPGVESRKLPEAPDLEYCRLFRRGNEFVSALYCGDPAIGKTIITPLVRQGAPFDTIVNRIQNRPSD